MRPTISLIVFVAATFACQFCYAQAPQVMSSGLGAPIESSWSPFASFAVDPRDPSNKEFVLGNIQAGYLNPQTVSNFLLNDNQIAIAVATIAPRNSGIPFGATSYFRIVHSSFCAQPEKFLPPGPDRNVRCIFIPTSSYLKTMQEIVPTLNRIDKSLSNQLSEQSKEIAALKLAVAELQKKNPIGQK